ncbi:uncharacterized protein LOC134718369 [Mytilus trossulus]|uniref:uncharacterized protein LOC134718369 n=1 Tax=Mytilus trossulus TaxID=6551 RepID=UPI003006277E
MASWDENLLTAAENGNIKEVELCVKNGANLECRDRRYERTPLIWAAWEGHLEVVTYLVTHGRRKDTINVGGCERTPGGGDLPGHSRQSVRRYKPGRKDTINVGGCERTPGGGDLPGHSRQSSGRTALHYAAENGQIDVTKCLIDQGCSPWVKTLEGKTPYDLVKTSFFYSEEKKKEVMEFLKVAGLDVKLVVGPEIVGLEVEFVVRPEVVRLEVEFVVGPEVVGPEVKLVGPGDTVVGPSIDDCGVVGGIALDKLWQTVMSKTSPEVTPDTHLQEPAAPVVEDSIGKGQKSAMLNRLLGKGSYESFDMRCMVTGQFSVGKTTLVKLLAGDVLPEGRHPTDGISLVEGRCGLDIQSKEWILVDPDSYNALDVVYHKVLMTSLEEEEESELTNKASDTSPTGYAKATLSSLPSEQSAAAQYLPSTKSSNVPHMVKQMEKKMRTRMTKEEIRKKMEKVLKSGKYKMKVGRLIFWDFGGQYVYLTTHQTFMTFRALFLVVFDGSKDLHEQVPDVMCFPGQHMTPTPAVFLQYWVNSILTYCKVVYAGIPKILFVATHKDKVLTENIEITREELNRGIEELFKDHEGKHHLVLRPLIFVNAKDQADPEIEVLKKTITELTFDHPCWGERMPNACVPLELEIAELVAEGKQIMSLAEVKELNAISEVSVLSPEQLTDFLHIHHSLGKIVYFDTPQLRDNVMINPLLMVEVMRSFITAY